MVHKPLIFIFLLNFTSYLVNGQESDARTKMMAEIENATSACDAGWLLIPGQGCFLFDLENEMEWMEAQVYCEDQGGYLPELIDNELEEILVEYSLLIGGLSEAVLWLGATDIGDEGQWLWIHSDTKVSEFFWATQFSQPDDGTSANCLLLVANENSESRLGWWDNACSGYDHSVVCQKPS